MFCLQPVGGKGGSGERILKNNDVAYFPQASFLLLGNLESRLSYGTLSHYSYGTGYCSYQERGFSLFLWNSTARCPESNRTSMFLLNVVIPKKQDPSCF
jgi:hypothetical protein